MQSDMEDEQSENRNKKKAHGDMNRSPAPNLDKLPQEIIEHVADFLGGPRRFASRDKDVASLVKTNRILYHQINGYLYHANQRSFHHHARLCGFHSRCIKEALTWGLARERVETIRRAFNLGIHPRRSSQSLPNIVGLGHIPTIDAYLDNLESGLLRVDAVHPGGETALYWAVSKYKHFQKEGRHLAKELIENHHAPVNHPVLYFTKLPLFEACRLGNMYMVELLIANGGWVNPPQEILHLMKKSASMKLEQKEKIYAPCFVDPFLYTWTSNKPSRRRPSFSNDVDSESSSDDDSSSDTSDNTFSSTGLYIPAHPQLENFLKEQKSHSPLEVAAEHGQVGVCEMLLGLGASLDSSPVFPEWTALHAAAYAGKPDVVALLLRHGAPPDRPGETYSALDAALGISEEALHGEYWQVSDNVRQTCECVRLLLEAGADPGPSLHVSRTLVACKRSLPGIAFLLHKKGANIRQEAPELLEEAVRACDLQLVKLLLAFGHREESEGNLLARHVLWTALLNQEQFSFDVIKTLLSSGAELDQTDANGRTLLHQLSATRFARVGSRCGLLSYHGADTGIRRSDTGFTAAHIAVQRINVDAVQHMARSPFFDMSLQDNDGRTPLFHAAMQGHDHLVNLMLSRGKAKDRRRWDKATADWSGNVADASGRMPIIAALGNGHPCVLKSFLVADPRTLLARDRQGHGVLWWSHANPNPRMRRMVQECARRSKIKLEDNLTDLYCRQCKYRSVSNWEDSPARYHCPICYGEDEYYICRECKLGGATCLDVAHEWQVG